MSDLERQLTNAQSGDEKAIGQIISQFGWIVRSECNRFNFQMNGASSGSDLSQEIWLRIWSNIDRFQFQDTQFLEARFESWLRAVSKNVLLNFVKKANRRHQGNSEEGDEFELNQIADQSRSPSSIVNLNLELDQLRKAINDLPEDQRTVITMHFIEKLTLGEVADQLNLTYDQVRHRIQLALRQLERKTDFS